MIDEDQNEPMFDPQEVDDHLDHADEILKIKLKVEPVQDAQNQNQDLIDQNKDHLKKLVSFKVSVDSHLKKNQDFLDIINKFIGAFVIDIKDEDVQKMAFEFVDKIQTLEKKLNVTKDIFEDFQKKLEEAQNNV